MDWACSQFFGVLYYGLFSFGKGRGPSNPLSVCAFFLYKNLYVPTLLMVLINIFKYETCLINKCYSNK